MLFFFNLSYSNYLNFYKIHNYCYKIFVLILVSIKIILSNKIFSIKKIIIFLSELLYLKNIITKIIFKYKIYINYT